jgi:hypothetical protein
MAPDEPQRLARVHAFVERHRAACLWFLRTDYLPRTLEEATWVLDLVARHGDVQAFQEAAEIRRRCSTPRTA